MKLLSYKTYINLPLLWKGVVTGGRGGFLLSLCLLSCTKDIDIDYPTVPEMYVIQADISDEPAKAFITMSREVNDSAKGKPLTQALVTLSDDNGRSEQLVIGSDGYFRSPSKWTGETGRTYTLNVEVDGKRFSAASTMPDTVRLDSMQFVWLSSAGMKMMLLKYWNTFPNKGSLAYTYARMFKNGKFYRSAMGKQTSVKIPQSQKLLGCTTESKMDKDDPEDQDVIIHDGDRIHLQLWSIDPTVYDYFFSLRVGKSNASNPITNITGGALGYFSAHHIQTLDTIFYRKDVKE